MGGGRARLPGRGGSGGSSIFPWWSGDQGVRGLVRGHRLRADAQPPRGCGHRTRPQWPGHSRRFPAAPRRWAGVAAASVPAPRVPHFLPRAQRTGFHLRLPGDPSAWDKAGAGEAAPDSGKPGRERADGGRV